MSAKMEIDVNMKDGASSVEKVRNKIKEVKKEAIATDKAIEKTGKGSGNMLSNVVGKIGDGFRNVNATLSKTGSLLGIGLSGAVAFSKILGEMERQAQQIREGIEGIMADMRAENVLRGAMGSGVIPTDTLERLRSLKGEMDKSNIRMLEGDYLEAAASLAGATGMKGEDLVEAVKTAMQIWASGSGAGTLQDAAMMLAQAIGVGETGTLRTRGIFLDESKFEGMDIEEKGAAVYASLKEYLDRMGALAQFAGSKDVRNRAFLAQMNERTAKEEFKQREGGGITAEMKTSALNYRAQMYDMGIDPDSWYNWVEFMRARALDPTSGASGAFLRWIAPKGGWVDQRQAATLRIDTNAPERKR